MLKPRFLRYLRLNDDPPNVNDDLTIYLPVEVIDLKEWFPFCQRLSQQYWNGAIKQPIPKNQENEFLYHKKAWDYELLTLDFCFKEDQSGPWFPLPSSDRRKDNADFLKDPNLDKLRWPESLSGIGPNTGLLIGSQLVAQSAQRDIPCGIAFHTYHKDIVINDMPSAMLATQMFLASGVEIPTRALHETMSMTIALVQESFTQPVLGLGTAASRFRNAFLRRAGASDMQPEGEVRLWVEPASLSNLLDIFRAAKNEKELNAKLEKFGLEFYDRNGSIHSLDIRSMFLDRLIYRIEEENLTDVRKYLPLADAKPAFGSNPEAGSVWQFVETLILRTPSNITPVMDFFRDSEGDREPVSINLVVKRDIHRLLALIFAWLQLFAENWFEEQDQSYDPLKKKFEGDFRTLTQQVGALLRIYDLSRDEGWKGERGKFDPKIDFLPLSIRKGNSISDLVREHAAKDSPLYRALRYDKSDSTNLSQRRLEGLEHLLAIAARWHCVEVETNQKTGKPTGRYRLRRVDVPDERPGGPDQKDIAQRLGFNLRPNQDPSKQLVRIIQGTPGFDGVGVTEFLNSLSERPLPYHLKSLGWEFMQEFWGPNSDLPLPYEAWPICLSELGREPGETKSLVEWRRGAQKREEAARAVQSLIVRPKFESTMGRYKIWCWSRSAENVGGDYYRVKKVSSEKCRIYIGDASGVGVGLPAALLIQQIHGVITILEEQAESAAEVCARLNTRLYEQSYGEDQQGGDSNSTTHQWASLICATLDTEANRFTLSNAGHPLPIIVRRDGTDSELATKHDSLALGQFADSVYNDDTLSLLPGDRLVFYTDGVREALGDELLKCIFENRNLGAAKLGEAVVNKLNNTESRDDQTLIVIAFD